MARQTSPFRQAGHGLALITVVRAAGTAAGMAAGMIAAMLPGLARAGDAATAPVRIELNKLEPAGEAACQAFFLIENRSGTRFESLKLDLVAFDGDGVVARRLAVELGPVRAEKTSLKVFSLGAIACDGVSRLLLNDVLACRDAESVLSDCLSRIETSSRAEIGFIE